MLTGSVTITKQELLQLLIDEERLSRLEAGGVDNWEGYSYAMHECKKQSLEDFREKTEARVAAMLCIG